MTGLNCLSFVTLRNFTNIQISKAKKNFYAILKLKSKMYIYLQYITKYLDNLIHKAIYWEVA